MAEPLKATFFTLQRRPRAVLVPATAATLAIIVALIGVVVMLNWGFISDLPRITQTLPPAKENGDQTAAFQFVSHIFGLIGSIFLFLIPVFVALAAYEAACLRWMIRGEAPGLFGLTLNNDTWRVYGTYWCWFLTQYAVSFVASIVMMPFMFMTMSHFMSEAKTDVYAMMRWQLSMIPISMLQYLPMIFLGLRLGPAAAASVARQRFNFFKGWDVTRGRFWALFGSYAVLWLIMIPTLMVILGVAMSPLIISIWPVVVQMFTAPTPDAMLAYFAALFSPQTLIVMGIAYVAHILVWVTYQLMTFGINARATLVALEDGKITPAA